VFRYRSETRKSSGPRPPPERRTSARTNAREGGGRAIHGRSVRQSESRADPTFRKEVLQCRSFRAKAQRKGDRRNSDIPMRARQAPGIAIFHGDLGETWRGSDVPKRNPKWGPPAAAMSRRGDPRGKRPEPKGFGRIPIRPGKRAWPSPALASTKV
jgi:hypothetical protein